MDYPIEQRTLGYILEDKTRKNSGRTLFYFEDKSFTYDETNPYANRVANGYVSLGIRKGDKVIVMLPNCAEFVFNWFGLAKLGAVECPINIAYKGDLLRHVILTSKAKVLFIHEDFLEHLIPIQGDIDRLENIVIFNPHKKDSK